jgi:hypothetical protein
LTCCSLLFKCCSTNMSHDWHAIQAIQEHVLSFLPSCSVLCLSILNKSFHYAAQQVAVVDITAPTVNNFQHLVQFFSRARVLRLRQCALPPPELLLLSYLHKLQHIVLHDIILLYDHQLLTISHACHDLQSLAVTSCHSLSAIELSLPRCRTLHLLRNWNLKRVGLLSDALCLCELEISECPMFHDTTALLTFIPNVERVDFSGSSSLERLCITDNHRLMTLRLNLCSCLRFVEVQSHALLILQLSLCEQLQRLWVVSKALKGLDVSMLPSLRSLILECPELLELDVTGASKLDVHAMVLSCPRLNSKRFLHKGTLATLEAIAVL